MPSRQDEAAAEDSLARVNIAPRNGWISDYPMTPDIIEEVRDSAARAAAAGGLNMSEEGAARAVSDVSSSMNLPVTAGGGYAQPGYNPAGNGSNPEYAGGAPPLQREPPRTVPAGNMSTLRKSKAITATMGLRS